MLGWIILVECCPGHWRGLGSSLASTHWILSSTHPQITMTPNVSRCCWLPLGGGNHPRLRTTAKIHSEATCDTCDMLLSISMIKCFWEAFCRYNYAKRPFFFYLPCESGSRLLAQFPQMEPSRHSAFQSGHRSPGFNFPPLKNENDNHCFSSPASGRTITRENCPFVTAIPTLLHQAASKINLYLPVFLFHEHQK